MQFIRDGQPAGERIAFQSRSPEHRGFRGHGLAVADEQGRVIQQGMDLFRGNRQLIILELRSDILFAGDKHLAMRAQQADEPAFVLKRQALGAHVMVGLESVKTQDEIGIPGVQSQAGQDRGIGSEALGMQVGQFMVAGIIDGAFFPALAPDRVRRKQMVAENVAEIDEQRLHAVVVIVKNNRLHLRQFGNMGDGDGCAHADIDVIFMGQALQFPVVFKLVEGFADKRVFLSADLAERDAIKFEQPFRGGHILDRDPETVAASFHFPDEVPVKVDVGGVADIQQDSHLFFNNRQQRKPSLATAMASGLWIF